MGIEIPGGMLRATQGPRAPRPGPAGSPSGAAQVLRFCAVGLTTTVAYFGLGSISALQVLAPRASAVAGFAVLGLADALATVARFVLLRFAMYDPRRQSSQPPDISRRTAA